MRDTSEKRSELILQLNDKVEKAGIPMFARSPSSHVCGRHPCLCADWGTETRCVHLYAQKWPWQQNVLFQTRISALQQMLHAQNNVCPAKGPFPFSCRALAGLLVSLRMRTMVQDCSCISWSQPRCPSPLRDWVSCNEASRKCWK